VLLARYTATVAATLATAAASAVWLYCTFLVLVFRGGDYCEDYGSCTDATPLAFVQVPFALAGIVALWVLVVRLGTVLLAGRPWSATWVPAAAVAAALIGWFSVVLPAL
jgi:hypothetical protein